MNVTFQLDDELLKRAKLVATRRDTSIARLVRDGLEQQVALDASIHQTGARGAYETLVEYSLGDLPRAVAMKRLGMDYYGDLIALLGAAGLPLPTVPAAVRAEMVAQMFATLGVAGAVRKRGGRGAKAGSKP